MTRLLVAVVLVLCLGLSCHAGPVPEALESFKLLVSEDSQAGGGASPAISPNGDRLAFYSCDSPFSTIGRVYTRGVSLDDPDTTVNGKKLDYTPGPELPNTRREYGDPPDIAWSPDGRQFAFVGRDGSLYVYRDVCRKYDPATKNAVSKVRKVAQWQDFEPIRVPCWSPDGSRIAFVREFGGGKNAVCVVDVASGAETVVANDAADIGIIWQQPWSPDGKRLVYAGGKASAKMSVFIREDATPSEKDKESNEGFIAVVSADGSGQKSVINKESGICPSWSTDNSVAFAASASDSYKLAEKRHVVFITMSLYKCDASGGNHKLLTDNSKPSKAEAGHLEAIFNKAFLEAFGRQYAAKLTAQQAHSLKDGKMTTAEPFEIAIAIYEKETGIKLDDSLVTTSGQPGNVELTPHQQKEAGKAMAFMQEALMSVMPEIMPMLTRMDMSPVWSPDGTKVAFLRGVPSDEFQTELVVRDLATGNEAVLVDHDHVDSCAWTADGKKLIAQVRRFTYIGGTGPDAKSSLSKPEVWLLEPK